MQETINIYKFINRSFQNGAKCGKKNGEENMQSANEGQSLFTQKACKSKYTPFASNQSVICNKWSYTNKSQQKSTTPIYPKPKQNI
jgi:hypothetical protein